MTVFNPPLLTEDDFMNLLEMVERSKTRAFRLEDPAMGMLQVKLRRSLAVPTERMPADVVTMNSRVCVRDMATGETMAFTVTYPDRANQAEGNISVLSPVGLALLGRRVVDVVTCDTPNGARRLRIAKMLYQPEAAGELA